MEQEPRAHKYQFKQAFSSFLQMISPFFAIFFLLHGHPNGIQIVKGNFHG